MVKIRVSLQYHRTKVDEMDAFAIGVRDGIYGHPTEFQSPVMTIMEFQEKIDNYANKLGAVKVGGSIAQGQFNIARIEIMEALDTQAQYVDGVANGDENIIRIAGFSPTKGTSSKTPDPEQFQEITLKRGSTGIIMAECEYQKSIDCYGCIVSANDSLPNDLRINDAGQIVYKEPLAAPSNGSGNSNLVQTLTVVIDFNKARKKKFAGLTPGITYYFTFYGINSAGVGTMSVPKSIVCW